MKHSALNIIFAGTPEFAATALAALIQSQHNIIAVYTQPDRPAGRGLQILESPVKKLAEKYQLVIFQPQTLKTPEAQETLAALHADLMVVAAYGLLLPKAVLEAPRLGCINIHASLLPRWRGASPIQRSILAGDSKTGISIMQMDAGLDTGPILLQAECPIKPDDTSESLHQSLAQLGAETLLKTLDQISQGKLQAKTQDNSLATHAAKIHKVEGKINWHSSALEIDRKIRAFYPWPIAYTNHHGETLRIFSAQVLAQTSAATPGTIVAVSRDGLDIASGDDTIRLLRVQAPGGRVLAIADFLNARQEDFVPGQQMNDSP